MERIASLVGKSFTKTIIDVPTRILYNTYSPCRNADQLLNTYQFKSIGNAKTHRFTHFDVSLQVSSRLLIVSLEDKFILK